MTPSVPGKAYFIAENQRHNAASSASVNSYLPGPEALPISADLLLRNISGKGMTFVLSDSSSTAPPLVEPANAAGWPPSSRRRQTPKASHAASRCCLKHGFGVNRG